MLRVLFLACLIGLAQSQLSFSCSGCDRGETCQFYDDKDVKCTFGFASLTCTSKCMPLECTRCKTGEQCVPDADQVCQTAVTSGPTIGLPTINFDCLKCTSTEMCVELDGDGQICKPGSSIFGNTDCKFQCAPRACASCQPGQLCTAKKTPSSSCSFDDFDSTCQFTCENTVTIEPPITSAIDGCQKCSANGQVCKLAQKDGTICSNAQVDSDVCSFGCFDRKCGSCRPGQKCQRSAFGGGIVCPVPDNFPIIDVLCPYSCTGKPTPAPTTTTKTTTPMTTTKPMSTKPGDTTVETTSTTSKTTTTRPNPNVICSKCADDERCVATDPDTDEICTIQQAFAGKCIFDCEPLECSQCLEGQTCTSVNKASQKPCTIKEELYGMCEAKCLGDAPSTTTKVPITLPTLPPWIQTCQSCPKKGLACVFLDADEKVCSLFNGLTRPAVGKDCKPQCLDRVCGRCALGQKCIGLDSNGDECAIDDEDSTSDCSLQCVGDKPTRPPTTTVTTKPGETTPLATTTTGGLPNINEFCQSCQDDGKSCRAIDAKEQVCSINQILTNKCILMCLESDCGSCVAGERCVGYNKQGKLCSPQSILTGRCADYKCIDDSITTTTQTATGPTTTQSLPPFLEACQELDCRSQSQICKPVDESSVLCTQKDFNSGKCEAQCLDRQCGQCKPGQTCESQDASGNACTMDSSNSGRCKYVCVGDVTTITTTTGTGTTSDGSTTTSPLEVCRSCAEDEVCQAVNDNTQQVCTAREILTGACTIECVPSPCGECLSHERCVARDASDGACSALEQATGQCTYTCIGTTTTPEVTTTVTKPPKPDFTGVPSVSFTFDLDFGSLDAKVSTRRIRRAVADLFDINPSYVKGHLASGSVVSTITLSNTLGEDVITTSYQKLGEQVKSGEFSVNFVDADGNNVKGTAMSDSFVVVEVTTPVSTTTMDTTTTTTKDMDTTTTTTKNMDTTTTKDTDTTTTTTKNMDTTTTKDTDTTTTTTTTTTPTTTTKDMDTTTTTPTTTTKDMDTTTKDMDTTTTTTKDMDTTTKDMDTTTTTTKDMDTTTTTTKDMDTTTKDMDTTTTTTKDMDTTTTVATSDVNTSPNPSSSPEQSTNPPLSTTIITSSSQSGSATNDGVENPDTQASHSGVSDQTIIIIAVMCCATVLIAVVVVVVFQRRRGTNLGPVNVAEEEEGKRNNIAFSNPLYAHNEDEDGFTFENSSGYMQVGPDLEA